VVDDRLARSLPRLLAHVAALALLPLWLAQATPPGGFVLLAVLAELFRFELGRPRGPGSS
jgi:hypothetical protein